MFTVKSKKYNGFSLISILLTIVITALLYQFFLKSYMKKTSIDDKIKETLAEEDIEIESYSDMVEAAKDTVDKLNKQLKERNEDLYIDY